LGHEASTSNIIITYVGLLIRCCLNAGCYFAIGVA
jgi:hypothetical protein